MKCSSVREKLFDYIDGALKGSDLRGLEDHLKSCSECRHELEKIQQLDAHLRQDIPAYLESVDPSPAFLTRLQRLELEAPPSKASSIFDSILAVFQEHRMAFGTGLAVILVVALALAIPTITQDDQQDTTTIAEPATAPPTAPEESFESEPSDDRSAMTEMIDQNNKATGGEGAAVPAPTTAPVSVESEEYLSGVLSPDAMTTPAPVPPPVPATPPAMPIPEPEDKAVHDVDKTILLGTDQDALEYTAAIIAITHPDVQQVIADREIMSIEVLHEVIEEDYTCDGPTVAITLNEMNPPENLIYVCVDLEKEKVGQIKTGMTGN